MRILAVDDDDSIRELLTAALSTDARYELWTAPSAADALDVMSRAKRPFECFLLDIQMPEMDGIDLCRRIRDKDEYAHTPILMLTAMAEKKFVDRAFTAGATDYITKPFEFLELFTRLSNAQRLNQERQMRAVQRQEVDSLKKDLERSFDHSLSEPIEILGVERLVGYVSFENYLLQLSRMKMLLTSVFAIKILNVEKVFRNMSRVAFRNMLAEVGSLIAEQYAEDGDLITYRGNGVFACATNSRKRFSQFQLEKNLNRRIREQVAARVSEVNVQVCAGEPVSLISFTRAGTLSSMQNAVTRAEMRAESYREILHMSTKVMHAGQDFSQQLTKERKVYEMLLQDAMKEEERVN
jgi:DNA-binding response OmpR family regulator